MYFVQVSTDNGKTFDTVKKTVTRSAAFAAYLQLAGEGKRTQMFKDNTLFLTTHLEDALAEQAKLDVKN